ncbi:hypothetical protein ACIF6L_34750 [Kitasatospora sp. NPDC086009]|uniref:hypothetical protein n=1 Tax=unclassified Kitasatospora TaxID=2633591 RepID=UPI0037C5CDDC
MTDPTTWRDQELHRLIDTTAAELTAAWTTLTTAQRAVLAAVRSTADTRRRAAMLRAALTRFNTAVAAFDAVAISVVQRWSSTELPIAYRHGAEAALHSAPWPNAQPRPAFAWTPGRQEELQRLSNGAYEVLARRVTETIRRARAFHRAVAETIRRRNAASPADLARHHRLDTVVYADNTRYPAAAWARSAIAAQAAAAANIAALRTAVDDLATEWVQVVDGPECGWTGHSDPDRANGTLRNVEDAAVHPIAHPGCIRALIPRPDLAGRTDIEAGQPASEEEEGAA